MRAGIKDETAQVYSTTDINAPVIAELTKGTEVELAGVVKKNGVTFVGVTIRSNQRGFLLGTTKIYRISQAVLNQGSADMYSGPSEAYMVNYQMKRGTRFYLIGNVEQPDGRWTRIRDLDGKEGYLKGKTKIRIVAERTAATKASGKRSMLYGALWFVGGTVVTIVTLSHAATSGGTYIVAWGAIVFGFIQFIGGLVTYLRAKS